MVRLAQKKAEQLRVRVYAEYLIDGHFVIVNRWRFELQNCSDFLVSMTLQKQAKHFPLRFGETIQHYRETILYGSAGVSAFRESWIVRLEFWTELAIRFPVRGEPQIHITKSNSVTGVNRT